MPQQTQPWETKTIKQAISDNEKTITLNLGINTEFKINGIQHKTDNYNFEIDLDSPFVLKILECTDETTVQVACEKAIEYILNSNECENKSIALFPFMYSMYSKVIRYQVTFGQQKKLFGITNIAFVYAQEILFTNQKQTKNLCYEKVVH